MEHQSNSTLEELEQRIARLEVQEEQLKKKLDTSEEHLNLALSAGNLAWWTMEVATGKATFNENKVKMLGYHMKEFQDAHYSAFTELIHPDDYNKAMQAMRDHLSGKNELYEVTYRIKHKDGHYIWFYDRGSTTKRDNEGKPVLVKGIVFDDTERQEALHSLRASKRALEEANATKDRFFSIIAHDLKGPLYSMIGLTNMVEESYDLFSDEDRKKFLHNMQQSAKGTYALLEQLLIWSRLQVNTIPFEPIERDLYEELHEVFYMLKQQAQSKDIELHSTIPENTYVVADKYMLQTILRNLLSNAIKFSNTNSKIAVDISTSASKEVKITVTDWGIGIPHDKVDGILSTKENYKQAGTNNEKGTGLGLILCKEFVAKHNGKIYIQSKEGDGTSVTFTLPTA